MNTIKPHRKNYPTKAYGKSARFRRSRWHRTLGGKTLLVRSVGDKQTLLPQKEFVDIQSDVPHTAYHEDLLYFSATTLIRESNAYFAGHGSLRDEDVGRVTELLVSDPIDESRWQAISPAEWASVRQRGNAETLTDPERVLKSLDSVPHKTSLPILFAESLSFDAGQQARLRPHLVSYIESHRNTSREDELVVLGAAIRQLTACLPISDLESLSDLLGASVDVATDAELELAKGLVYRLGWDSERPVCPKLCGDLYDLAVFHSSKRTVDSITSGAIALNAIIALALLSDERAVELTADLARRSQPWFVSLVANRCKRFISKWAKEGKEADALGLVPKLIDAIA